MTQRRQKKEAAEPEPADLEERKLALAQLAAVGLDLGSSRSSPSRSARTSRSASSASRSSPSRASAYSRPCGPPAGRSRNDELAGVLDVAGDREQVGGVGGPAVHKVRVGRHVALTVSRAASVGESVLVDRKGCHRAKSAKACRAGEGRRKRHRVQVQIIPPNVGMRRRRVYMVRAYESGGQQLVVASDPQHAARAYLSRRLKSPSIREACLTCGQAFDDFGCYCIQVSSLSRCIALARLRYEDYLCSPEWRRIAAVARRRDCGVCVTCRSARDLTAHHRWYGRRGREELKDVTTLCWTCHATVHEHVPALARRNGRRVQAPVDAANAELPADRTKLTPGGHPST